MSDFEVRARVDLLESKISTYDSLQANLIKRLYECEQTTSILTARLNLLEEKQGHNPTFRQMYEVLAVLIGAASAVLAVVLAIIFQ